MYNLILGLIFNEENYTRCSRKPALAAAWRPLIGPRGFFPCQVFQEKILISYAGLIWMFLLKWL